jgi:hypothetical protein
MEYLLYYLSKTPAENRRAGISLDEEVDVGTAIHPLGWKNEPGDNLGAPGNQAHGNLSQLFWSPGSDAILFLDQVLEESDLVLIQVNSNGPAGALVHPVPETVECEAAAPGRDAPQPVGIQRIWPQRSIRPADIQ